MTVTPHWQLRKHPRLKAPAGPVCLVVLDGVGLGPADDVNAWHLAKTPFLDRLVSGSLSGRLKAHGVAVGMPTDGDMGNSEVGHNALGAGRIFDQGAKLVGNALRSGRLFEGKTWRNVMNRVQRGGTLHLLGLWSDGNVHSHIDQAYGLVERAVQEGAKCIRLHLLLDGRDVGETSALEYVEPLEARLADLRRAGVDAAVASGGGRMFITMDRYEADWEMVKRGWDTHVLGEARRFPSAAAAIRTFRAEEPGLGDQYLPPFVVGEQSDSGPLIVDGDAVVFFNFRGDRAIEISRAFDEPAGAPFPFERRYVPDVFYAGMMEYDGDLHIPQHYLVDPPTIDRTMGEFLALHGRRQLACSETQKFGHVTYFFNGNRSGMFDESREQYIEIPSDNCDFSERPWMKAAEITDASLLAIDERRPDFVRLNYANGDMVGHTGVLKSAIEAMESLDVALSRFVNGVLARDGVCLVTADHGNCEQMGERDKKTGLPLVGSSPEGFVANTSHSRFPVPVALATKRPNAYQMVPSDGLSSLAAVSATCLNLLGFEEPEGYLPGFIDAR